MFRYQHSSDSEYSVTTSQRGGSNMDPVSNLYNNTISEEEILSFINENLSKIKYDKINKCIIDIQGLSYKLKDNKGELFIKKKINTISKDSRLNKLRKSLKKRK